MTAENVVTIVMLLFLFACMGSFLIHWITMETFIGAICGCAGAILLGLLTHSMGTGICLLAMLGGAIGGGYLWSIVPTTIKKILMSIIVGTIVIILIAAVLNATQHIF
jgi:Na+/proline symporter